MIPLIVLAQVLPLLNNQLTLISNLEKDIVKDEMERLKQTIMSPSEWREYLSINFPESAMAFFNEVPASGSEKGKTALRKAHEKYDRLLPILTRIQEMFVLPPPKPVVAAPFIPEAKKRTREIEAPVVVEAVEPATEKKGKVETLEEKRTRVKNEFNKTMENIEQHKLKGGQYWMYDTYMGGDVRVFFTLIQREYSNLLFSSRYQEISYLMKIWTY